MARNRREREAPDLGACALRMIRALVRRAEAGDWEALEQLAMLEDVAASATGEALTRMQRGTGAAGVAYSWAQLGDVLGVTRQSAQQRSDRWVQTHGEPA